VSENQTPSQPADTAEDAARALQAVQVALDRRDNGGDAAPDPAPAQPPPPAPDRQPPASAR
jgi:hypothetical protein